MKQRKKNNIDFSEGHWYNKDMFAGYGVAW